MFDTVVVDDEDVEACAAGLHDSIRATRLAAASRLARAVHWADLHAPAPGTAGVATGGEGTPSVAPFTATELGCLLQTTTASAARLMADGLDLRHRLPRHWAAVMTGRVEDWRARHLAKATRAAGLSQEQARQVDAECVEASVGLAWGRALCVIEAAIIRADPAGHEARRAAAEHERYVTTSRRDATTGLRTLIARTTAGDVARLDAMVAHLADLLRATGDADDLQVRRAKAIAILADPARACLLLAHGHRSEGSGTADVTEPERDEEHHVSSVDAAAELGRLLLAQGAGALARLRPRTVVYLHLTDVALRARAGVARVEGIGPAALGELHELLGRDSVVVRPVLDPLGQTPVDAYETPAGLREAVGLLHPFEVFPYGTRPSRTADLDHTVAYRPPDDGGPPGQTRIDNLGPLARGHHNAKTFGGFELHQPRQGLYLWRTPSGYWYRVDHTGTRALGRDRPAALDNNHSVLEGRFERVIAAA